MSLKVYLHIFLLKWSTILYFQKSTILFCNYVILFRYTYLYFWRSFSKNVPFFKLFISSFETSWFYICYLNKYAYCTYMFLKFQLFGCLLGWFTHTTCFPNFLFQFTISKIVCFLVFYIQTLKHLSRRLGSRQAQGCSEVGSVWKDLVRASVAYLKFIFFSYICANLQLIYSLEFVADRNSKLSYS